MSNIPTPSHGVMEANGAYNRHAKLPAGGAALAVPLLEKAVQSVELDPKGPIESDYGRQHAHEECRWIRLTDTFSDTTRSPECGFLILLLANAFVR